MSFEFQEWPKIPRLNRDIVVTEKIDGTNAAIQFDEDGHAAMQSRKRLITVEDDNFGFAKWVWYNQPELFAILGPGIHFGEWWGSGIQRGYGLPKGEKRFSLFNTSRWEHLSYGPDLVPGLGAVPVLYEGPFRSYSINRLLDDLEANGSVAAPGFPNPEGVVVFHNAANLCFKATIENDEQPKGFVA